MKKLIISSASLLFSITLFAQSIYTPPSTVNPTPQYNFSDINKFSITFNFGAGIPMEDYGNISQVPFPGGIDSAHVNGLASTGFHFNGTAGYLFSKNFGVMVMVGGTSNSFNNEVWHTLRVGGTPGIITSVYNNFYIGQYLIGLNASIPASTSVKVGFKALFGMVTANYPTLTESFQYYGTTVVIVKNITGSTDLGYYLGANLTIMLTKNIGLEFNAGYLGSNITYPEVDLTVSQTGYQTYSQPFVYDRFMLLGILQTTGGLSFNF